MILNNEMTKLFNEDPKIAIEIKAKLRFQIKKICNPVNSGTEKIKYKNRIFSV